MFRQVGHISVIAVCACQPATPAAANVPNIRDGASSIEAAGSPVSDASDGLFSEVGDAASAPCKAAPDVARTLYSAAWAKWNTDRTASRELLRCLARAQTQKPNAPRGALVTLSNNSTSLLARGDEVFVLDPRGEPTWHDDSTLHHLYKVYRLCDEPIFVLEGTNDGGWSASEIRDSNGATIVSGGEVVATRGCTLYFFDKMPAANIIRAWDAKLHHDVAAGDPHRFKQRGPDDKLPDPIRQQTSLPLCEIDDMIFPKEVCP